MHRAKEGRGGGGEGREGASRIANGEENKAQKAEGNP